LSEIQKRVLEAVAGVEPPFILSGRTTRDLDLFWRNRPRLEDLPYVVEQSIATAGFVVETLRTTPAFVQLRVNDPTAMVVVDLIAESADSIEPPGRHRVGDAEILVDSARAILAEKLCALLERSELRDLVDIEALLRSGERLDVALADAPRRDRGFSPLTLAWVLRDLDVRRLAPAAGLDEAAAAQIDAFRRWLIGELLNVK